MPDQESIGFEVDYKFNANSLWEAPMLGTFGTGDMAAIPGVSPEILRSFLRGGIFEVFSAEGFELQAVGKEADFGSRRLKPGVKKYGLFQELFFVAHQQVKGDWAIC
jgi:hypothetical protein